MTKISKPNQVHHDCKVKESRTSSWTSHTEVFHSSQLRGFSCERECECEWNPGCNVHGTISGVGDKLYIVDLPGYGYATVSKKIKEDIKTMHKNYFKLRKELLYTFLLIDIRHDIQKKDIEFMEFLIDNYCPFVIIFTKSDKLKIKQLDIQIDNLKEQLSKYWEDLPKMFVTSSKNKLGINEIHSFIESSLNEYAI